MYDIIETVLRIRDVYPGSRIRICSIPVPDLGSGVKKIPDPGSRIRIRIKECKYFQPKKLFLSSRKYDPGSRSQISDQDLDFFTHPGFRIQRSKKAPDSGSGSATLDRKRLSVWKGADAVRRWGGFKGTVSWDRLKKFWQKFTELGLTKGRSRFLNFLWAPMIL